MSQRRSGQACQSGAAHVPHPLVSAGEFPAASSRWCQAAGAGRGGGSRGSGAVMIYLGQAAEEGRIHHTLPLLYAGNNSVAGQE